MKRTCFILGIFLIIIGILALMVAALFAYAGMHTLDGSADLYSKQRQMMLISLLIGIVVLAIGIYVLVMSRKMH